MSRNQCAPFEGALIVTALQCYLKYCEWQVKFTNALHHITNSEKPSHQNCPESHMKGSLGRVLQYLLTCQILHDMSDTPWKPWHKSSAHLTASPE